MPNRGPAKARDDNPHTPACCLLGKGVSHNPQAASVQVKRGVSSRRCRYDGRPTSVDVIRLEAAELHSRDPAVKKGRETAHGLQSPQLLHLVTLTRQTPATASGTTRQLSHGGGTHGAQRQEVDPAPGSLHQQPVCPEQQRAEDYLHQPRVRRPAAAPPTNTTDPTNSAPAPKRTFAPFLPPLSTMSMRPWTPPAGRLGTPRGSPSRARSAAP